MKAILFGIFMSIFSLTGFAQPKLGIPFEMKKGDVSEIEGLKIKYIGGEREWTSGVTKDGERLDIHYLRYKFEITADGKTEKFQVVSPVRIGNLVLQVFRPPVEENQNDEICRLALLTSAQFEAEQKNAQSDLAEIVKLSTIDYFAVEPVGEGGETSEGEILARKILARRNPETAFQGLLRNGNPQARLYALWALRKIHGRKSDKYFTPYRELSTDVKRMSGCLIFSEKFSEAVRQIENPHYLKMKAKELWQMDLERRRALLTGEEERFLLSIFRIYKSADELDKIADLTFGEIFQKQAERILGN